MKLATALAQRAELQVRIRELGTRLNNNAKTQEGEAPAEDPTQLLKELEQDTLLLETLVRSINMTNSLVTRDGVSLTCLLARRDALKLRLQTMRAFLNAASEKVDRYSRTEILIKSTVNVA